MQRQDFDIATLFAGYLADNLTDEQQKMLDDWKSASEENLALFERVCQGANLRELNRMAGLYNRELAWQKMERNFKAGKTVSIRRWMAWVAVLVLPLGFSYLLVRHFGGFEEKGLVTVVAGIEPGGPKAILTLADGSVMNLKEENAFRLEEKDGTRIVLDSAVLTYRVDFADQKNVGKQVYNKVDIPRGGEYSVVLSDGTVVSLNAMSSLRYPVNFTGNTREVELVGEAYFQVKKDSEHPFIVRTKEIQVQVLGTEFNVSAYPRDAAIKTTLVQGSVKVEAQQGGESVVIKPSQQAVFSKSAGTLEVEDVDVSEYIAWKNGKFDFRDWRLEDMMNYLSRWYDIEVFYQNEDLKDMRFGGYINRYSEIKPILEFLESTGKIRISLTGNTVIINQK